MDGKTPSPVSINMETGSHSYENGRNKIENGMNRNRIFPSVVIASGTTMMKGKKYTDLLLYDNVCIEKSTSTIQYYTHSQPTLLIINRMLTDGY
jgi:hypothetical protein